MQSKLRKKIACIRRKAVIMNMIRIITHLKVSIWPLAHGPALAHSS